MGITSVGHIASSATMIAASQSSSSSGRTTTGTVARATAHGTERFDRIFYMSQLTMYGAGDVTVSVFGVVTTWNWRGIIRPARVQVDRFDRFGDDNVFFNGIG
jgi:hypothetical protein